ncbi:AtpZ/AtpI family protein [Sungkyunkwania multivorans]|uniref:AtpZ/AtpI family protein n=1 Tax=Sungkyunkwania multivorans TaxID=1173618 RepID=A0ABW3CZI1_9FLAO
MNKKPKRQLNKFIALTGIALQMGITIYLFVRLGKWLDVTYNNGENLYLIITTLVGMGVAIYAVLLQLKRLEK